MIPVCAVFNTIEWSIKHELGSSVGIIHAVYIVQLLNKETGSTEKYQPETK